MPYLRNPSGRIVCVDDIDLYNKWVNTQGFSKIDKIEEQEFISGRYKIVSDQEKKEEIKEGNWIRGVHISTVADGGKDGYGVASEKIIKGLVNEDVNISRSFKNQKVGLLFHNPYSVLKMESPIKIIYTMFESTKIPDDWIEYLRVADKVIVPSRWCRDVFKKSGIDAEVVELGYDDDIFRYKERYNKRKKKEVFNFVHYNAFNIRKGFCEVFKAFVEEFEKDEPVKLILKTTLACPPIPIREDRYPNIEIIADKYSEKELVDLLHRSDCMVYPSRGEGFGMTPIEAMATGIPAIVPNAHGITEYFDKNYMYEVKVKEECPALYQRYKGEDVGKMVICDVKDLRKKMRWVYEHQDEAIEKGKQASDYVRQWTFRKTANKLKKVIESAYDMEVKGKESANTLQLIQVK